MARVEKSRAKVREEKRAEMLDWYLSHSNGRMPECQVEDKKAYRGSVIWYLEPPIPGVRNPMIIEEYIGDNWSLRVVERLDPVKVFVPR